MTDLHRRRRARVGKPLPFRITLRITLGAMSSSRLSSATVFSPATIRCTVARLNSTTPARISDT